MEFEHRYTSLNAAQRQAVDTIEGPVMVIAGPGTGKTELLGMRVANILKKTDTLPENILCLTFTESGAVAMRDRLIGIIGQAAYKIPIHTFHSFGSEIINQNREHFYRGALFQPAEELSIYEIVRTIFDELEYSNPLATTSNGEYVHLRDTITVISELKKSGLTSDELLAVLDANDEVLEKADQIILPVLSDRIAKGSIDRLRGAPESLRKLTISLDKYAIVPLNHVIADSLQEAIETADALGKTSPLTAWKRDWLKLSSDKTLIFKARERQEKLRAASYIYYQYLVRMEEASLYDFDDMILQVVHAMEVKDDLRFNVQENYQYILVDEFQDTNLAQMRLITSLADNPVNEGRPNILVVGDDDQAIFSFQGADISNILTFQQAYPTRELIVLTENYRSTANILTASRNVIVQGEGRLENTIEGINKELHANTNTSGTVALREAASQSDERRWLAHAIKSSIEKGTKPTDIAVLARRHYELEQLLPYFADAGVNVSYERSDDVLELEPIRLLYQLATFIMRLAGGDHDGANGIISQVLAHPAWGFKPKELWQLSASAYDNRLRWLDAMATNPRFESLHAWFIELVALSTFSPLEHMLDRMIGYQDDELVHIQASSPLFQYFFSEEKLAEDPGSYIYFLEGLATLRNHLKEFRPKSLLTLATFIEYIELHLRLGSRIQITQSIAASDTAINLLTAHKSKGLEYDSVYIIGATDNMWGEKSRSRSRLISYPENLPIAPAGETRDERLRLFYVAMTRAKRHLTISYSRRSDLGKPLLKADFIAGMSIEPELITPGHTTEYLTHSAELAWYHRITTPSSDLKVMLAPMLASYKLSATHVNTFLDVTIGGPQAFLLQNLLHFPQSRSPQASYGLVVHKTLQQAHLHVIATGTEKPTEDVLRDFENNLREQRLSTLDFDTYLQKGVTELPIFLSKRSHTFTQSQRTELNFAGQHVMLGEARLTGLLDLIDVDKQTKTITVSDYKTGKPAKSWVGVSDYEKIKLHKYRQQLMFYKLLLEGSRDYGTYEVKGGILEFVEPDKTGEVRSLILQYDDDELERYKRLIGAVWEHIVVLDLPDVSAYDLSYKGILAFEEYLLGEQE
ncbi:MAG: uvrD [Candidatus Saccharibacteria bacterium]|nr:uvrD [Candidatus Saccharibacteria bacterium]